MAPGAPHINSRIGAIVAFGPAEVRSEPQREPPHVRPVERGGERRGLPAYAARGVTGDTGLICPKLLCFMNVHRSTPLPSVL